MDDQPSYIAMCLTCLVSDRLKACHAFQFNIGLGYKPLKAGQDKPIEADKNSVFSQSTQKESISHEGA